MLRIRNQKAGWHRAAVLALVFAAVVGMIGSSAAFAADLDGMQELGANPTALSFGNVAIGATSASQTDTVTNTFSDDAITFSSVIVTHGYTQTGTTCGSTLAPLASCEVDVACKPTSNGYLFGVLAFFYTSSDISAEIDPWDSLPKVTFVKLTCTGMSGGATATPTATSTATQTATSTATATATPTDTVTATATPTVTATSTATPTATASATQTATSTATSTATATATATATDTPTTTATATQTATNTATASPTTTATSAATPTATATAVQYFLVGTAVQNGMNGAAITAVSVNPDGSDHSVLANTTADSRGNFSVSINIPPNSPVRLRASGGTYVSEQNGATISSPSPLTVLLPSVNNGIVNLQINPLTTFVDSLARGNVSRGEDLATAASNATASIDQYYGISSDPSALRPLYTSAAIGTDAGRLGLILGALVNEDQLFCKSPNVPGGLVAALASDISDGVFDGMNSGSAISYCGDNNLPAIAGTAQFGDALAGMQGLALSTSGFTFGGTNNSLTLNSVTAAQVAAEAVEIESAVVTAAPPSIDTFAATTPLMNTARDAATATLLPNPNFLGGQVLIAGGENNFAPISSTELYNPVTNTFAASTPSMNTARWVATATLLPNGKVLIAGGQGNGGAALSSVELYDPLTNTFAASTPTMNAGRTGATATLLPNGKVLIAGGSFLNSIELYDPATNTFAAAASMPTMITARSFPTATLLPNGKVLIAGGAFNSSQSGAGDSAELYDPATNTFTASPQMNHARYVATATLLPNGKVLIAGGTQDGNFPLSSTELYDPVTNTFAASTPAMNTARFAATAALLPNGKVMIAGGFGNAGFPTNIELYDPVANTFAATTPSMKAGRYFATETLLLNGKVLIAGGMGNGFLSSTELYTR
jgi:hypothetical protein